MKPVQVLFDEQLLRRLSESTDVQNFGRSEVVRRAVRMYLKIRADQKIAEEYRSAYANTVQLEEELSGWAEEGQWENE